MNNDRLLSFLGICKRAGSLLWGAQTVEKTVKEGKARLLLYARDVSENSLKRVLTSADDRSVPVRRLPCDKEALSFALGRYCGIVCVTDAGFAKKLLEMMD